MSSLFPQRGTTALTYRPYIALCAYLALDSEVCDVPTELGAKFKNTYHTVTIGTGSVDLRESEY